MLRKQMLFFYKLMPVHLFKFQISFQHYTYSFMVTAWDKLAKNTNHINDLIKVQI